MAQPPTIDKASFGDGTGWLIAGGELLARGGAPLLRVALVVLLISLLQIVPAIGPLLLVLISPLVTAGLLDTFRRVEAGEPVAGDSVLAGFRDPGARARLLMLGGVLLLGTGAAIGALGAWLSPQMDLQALTQLMADPETMNQEPERLIAMFEGVNVFGGLVIAAAIFAVTLAALYFGVPLVFFWHWPVAAALLFSLRALLINWLAFLGFGLVLVGTLLAAGILYGLIAGIVSLALGAAGAFFVQLLSMALSLFVQLLVAAAQWRAFVRVFPAGPGQSDGDGGDAVEV
jgi:hypothetical protein